MQPRANPLKMVNRGSSAVAYAHFLRQLCDLAMRTTTSEAGTGEMSPSPSPAKRKCLESEEEEELCAICLSQIEDEARLESCGHEYCFPCILSAPF